MTSAPPKKSPAVAHRFAVNNRQMAGVLGLRVPKQRRKLAALMAEIEAWKTLPGFPKKSARGFDVLELKAWHLGHLRSEIGKHPTSKSGRKADTSPSIPLPGRGGEGGGKQTAQPSLPPRGDGPGDGDELFAGTGFEATLDLWEDKLKNPTKWLMAPIQMGQIKKLEQYRPHLFPGGNGGAVPGADSGPVPNQVAMANFLQEKYQFPCSEQDVSDWKTFKRLPAGAPGFPPPEGRWGWKNAGACCAWFEQWIVNPAKAAAGGGQLNLGDIGLSARAMNAKMQQDIDAAALKRLELENAQRADDRNYIRRAEHLALCEGGNKLVSALVTAAIEKTLVERFKVHPVIGALAEELRAGIIEALRTVAIEVNQQLHLEIPQRLKELEKA